MHRFLFALFLLAACRGEGHEGHPAVPVSRTKEMAARAKTFNKERNFSNRYCILVDMSMHSGLNRLFVWDFRKDTVVFASLVSHGSGSYPWSFDLTKTRPGFSNVPNSHCSSLGKYKIGERGHSSWGIGVKYLLHGLEPTNSKALERFIVLHSWDKISDREVYPAGTPESWGCPAVSDNSMRYLDRLLRQEDKPVLLWIYR